jgi:PAS domain S-box-containing protein/putative nucleotidyltransferase with HDIG domain
LQLDRTGGSSTWFSYITNAGKLSRTSEKISAINITFIVEGVKRKMKQEMMNNLHEESSTTLVYDRIETDRGSNGSRLSDSSLKKYNDLLEDLSGGHRPVIGTKDSLHLDNAQKMLRNTEEKVRRIFDNSFDGIAVLDLNGIITEANPKILEISGLHTEAEMVGRSYMEFVAQRDRNRIQTILSGERITGLECSLIRNNGGEVFIEINTMVLNDIFGYPFGYLLAVKDVTRRKRDKEENIHVTAKLLRVMGEIIEAMAHMVEIRDPYTAGHQRRVSQLAAAIATEMGLSREIIEGVRVAGMVHDIGKIYIPAEILSKPAKLNDMEYRMIKQHSKLSYDILNTIEFPWPVATIVYQHHERFDGSGYPRGLSGKDITLEARILAVADVVEAMASHRPYRAALGIEKALDEISQQRGKLYDPDIVDACIKILKSGYSFNFD